MTTTTVQSIQILAAKNSRPLESGDRLTCAEFERRNAAMPQIKRVELNRGVGADCGCDVSPRDKSADQPTSHSRKEKRMPRPKIVAAFVTAI